MHITHKQKSRSVSKLNSDSHGLGGTEKGSKVSNAMENSLWVLRAARSHLTLLVRNESRALLTPAENKLEISSQSYVFKKSYELMSLYKVMSKNLLILITDVMAERSKTKLSPDVFLANFGEHDSATHFSNKKYFLAMQSTVFWQFCVLNSLSCK